MTCKQPKELKDTGNLRRRLQVGFEASAIRSDERRLKTLLN